MEIFSFVATSLGAAIILAALSLMFYKETPLFRWAEYSVIGLGIGWGVVVTTWKAVDIAIEPLLAGDISVVVPLILGLLTYTQFTKKYRWTLRWPLAIISSVSLALALSGLPLSAFILQLREIAVPLTVGNAYDIFNAVISIAAVVTCLSYFTFTHEHKGLLNSSAKIGRYFMMLAFGAAFGVNQLSQAAHMLSVFIFLVSDWLKLVNIPSI